jgi:hypothetical protein
MSKASSQSVNNMGAGTVVGNVRGGSDKAAGASMKTGHGAGAGKGSRGTFLAGAGGVDYQAGVQKGTLGGAVKGLKTNGTVIKSDGGIPGTLSPKLGAAKTMAGFGTMKQGKGKGATKGTHKGFL